MTADEFALVHTYLSATDEAQEGLINVNTAREAVLACIPGIGIENAPAMVAFRAANPSRLDSMAWIVEVLDEEAIDVCAPFLTDQAYQVAADIATVGAFGRGYHRDRYVFDTSEAAPKIIFRRDMTSLGWALGVEVREQLQLARSNLR
jgi:hypothetical protein